MIKHAAVLALAGFLSAGSLFAAKSVTVSLKDSKDQPIGTATINEAKKGGVTILLKVKGLPPGTTSPLTRRARPPRCWSTHV
jgi:hypothetical protein